MRILNAEQMRAADRYTIEELGIPSIVLMENAGRQVVAVLEASFSPLDARRVAVLAGRGSNGGDGFVVARTLLERALDVPVFLIGGVSEVRGDARANLDILGRLGVSVVEITDEQAWELHSSELLACDVVVDAIFGTGLKAPLEGVLQTIVADLNASGLPVVSVDIPSGLSADTHALPGEAVRAGITVTLGAPKIPLILPPASRFSGQVVVADIGIPSSVIESLDGPRLEVITRDALREHVAARDEESHKGDFGRVLVVAGSRGKTGAGHLAAMAAIKSGAGLVTVATPASCQPILAAMAPEYMTIGLPETPDGRVTSDALDAVLAVKADVIAVGPGLGAGPEVAAFVGALLERTGTPLVMDADALNAFVGEPARLQGREDLDVVITPHPGEIARLIGLTADEVQEDRVEVARTFATTHRLHVVLKGHRTLVASPDGSVAVNLTGNAGMATGGTGDVLTGVVGGWFAQLLDADVACRLGVYLHGLAGDLAEADEGETALAASDVVAHLGDAVLELAARERPAADPSHPPGEAV